MTTELHEHLVVSRKRSFGREVILACDGNCAKAWGINNHPKVELSDDEDDYAFLADDELGIAPTNPGTYEDGQGKPPEPVHNKWCLRECERSASCEVSKFTGDLKLPDFSQRIFNMPQEQP